MSLSYYNTGRQLCRDTTINPVNKQVSVNFDVRRVAAALYGIAGIDATEYQLRKAREAIKLYQKGWTTAKIIAHLKIKGKQHGNAKVAQPSAAKAATP